MITSHRNSLVKRLRRLRQKKYRLQENAGLVEGIRAVLTAVEHAPHLIDTIVYAPDLLTSDIALGMIGEQEARGVPCAALTADVFAAASERDNPTGLAAIVRSPVVPLSSLPRRAGGIYVVLENIADPGNLGTILRTLDGVGAAGCILYGQTTDVTHPTALKASMGSAFTVPLAAIDTLEGLLGWAEDLSARVVAASAHGSGSYWAADLRPPVVLLLGSEQHGLSPELAGAAGLTVKIPMWGRPTSLNVGVAAALLVYEVRRQAADAMG